MKTPKIQHDELLRRVRYDALTGELFWLSSRGLRTAGAKATKIDRIGYSIISLEGEQLKAHRVVWFFFHGQWPREIDHINGVKTDNRIQNLREATRSQNGANRKPPLNRPKGMTLRRSGRWAAQIRHLGKTIYLGTHDTVEGAHTAYKKKARELFGEFSNTDL